ncbi:class I SAM-dependent methyltransferase [Aspergillus alliaceus]|uniref:class I SAM-dependent methyltransferase n=1 Tax=Petromyces alliaceus TaxID=209559 RepID=UPI0012A4DDBB|nr:S-adenosyl-L-methionine-dependent methyltransferase [Aspergillus alliaceus]KAB8229060.1 S-adenosyl-L-methionine-dependent methyltransferase [Aspergillus alliaceus]
MTDTQIVADWYNRNAALEHDRLNNCRLEFSISLKAIHQCVELLGEQRPLRILDVGGGTGRYAVELARRGHSVTLTDISESELNLAKSLATEFGVTLEAIVTADARSIQVGSKEDNPQSIFITSAYDLILCQGPMYHLLEESERLHVLCACASMLRPGGILAVAFVTRYAHLRDIAQREPARLAEEFDSFYREYLSSGKYTRNPTMTSHHTSAEGIRGLFHKADGQLRTRENVGLALTRILACEGFLGGGLAGRLGDLSPGSYERWVDVVMQFAEDEGLLGNADHLLAIAERK